MRSNSYGALSNPTKKEMLDQYVLMKEWIQERSKLLGFGRIDQSVANWEMDCDDLREEINNYERNRRRKK